VYATSTIVKPTRVLGVEGFGRIVVTVRIEEMQQTKNGREPVASEERERSHASRRSMVSSARRWMLPGSAFRNWRGSKWSS